MTSQPNESPTSGVPASGPASPSSPAPGPTGTGDHGPDRDDWTRPGARPSSGGPAHGAPPASWSPPPGGPPTAGPAGYGQPGYPAQPGQQAGPGHPGHPGGPGQAGGPGYAGGPGQPGGPGYPNGPGQAGGPVYAGGPGQPGFPPPGPSGPGQPGGRHAALGEPTGGYPTPGGYPQFGGSAPPDQPAGGYPGFGAPAINRDPVAITAPLRQPAALVLLAANAVFLFFALVDLFVVFEDWSHNFVNRIDASAFGQFVGLVPVLFPLLAVLIATHLRPALPQARLITVAALVEYGVSAVFGAICMLVGFLHGLTLTGSASGMSQPRAALETFLVRGAWMVVLLFAGYAVYLLFQGLYAPPKPPQYPGGYPAPYPYYAYPQPQQPPAEEETKITPAEPQVPPGS